MTDWQEDAINADTASVRAMRFREDTRRVSNSHPFILTISHFVTIGQYMSNETRKQAEIRKREDEVLAVALSLLSGEAAQSVTMDVIAATVGISKGTLYNHFASKDDVYGALVIKFSNAVIQRLEQVRPTDDARKRAREFLGVFWDSYRENMAYLRIASYCEREGFRASLSADIREQLGRLDNDVLRLTSEIFAAGVATGQFRRVAIQDLMIGPHLVLIGLSQFLRNNDVAEARYDPRFRALVKFVLAGVERVGDASGS